MHQLQPVIGLSAAISSEMLKNSKDTDYGLEDNERITRY